VEALGWIEVKGRGALTRDMFVARAVGRSMEPKIHSGDLLVFRAEPEGARQGRIVLAQYRGPADPETGGSFTVKVYSSVKAAGKDDALHKQIVLKPLNRNFQPIRLQPERAEDFRIVADYLFTLS
jgi:SOS-response transcriptional repressor LexA